MSRVWFVTGASQGFGKPAVEEALSRGDLVVAAVRNTSSLDDLAAKHSSDKLLIVKCDVTKLHDITSAFDLAYEKFGRVDVVFNHAGTTIFSEAETEQEELARNLFEVNFWGAVYVMKEAVKAFRERNAPGSGGRLLNMSSAAGFAATPGAAYYTAR
ncbi:hypothetical protein ONZ45_g19713 [Pleurotus djamor]|nr:hypothetical protein ONZ45_g19713 [Pleurotus djamor]